MSQSQNAIFISPTGEENLMNISHRDSESITGESSLINIEVLFLACKICHDETRASPSILISWETNWINLSFSWSPSELSKSALCVVYVRFFCTMWALVSRTCIILIIPSCLSICIFSKDRVAFLYTLQTPDNSLWHLRSSQDI